MSTSILTTGNDHVRPVAHSVSEFVQATGSGDPFGPIKIIVTSLCVAVIGFCAAGAVIEHKRYGELVHSIWVKAALFVTVIGLAALLFLSGCTYL
ncbi:hypothetical protein [Corynebacterium bovis]|uniref:hypothetical protein n=1 Tax=Corynebacterium bovis TaxID=36808 RepID=UPI003138CFA0